MAELPLASCNTDRSSSSSSLVHPQNQCIGLRFRRIHTKSQVASLRANATTDSLFHPWCAVSRRTDEQTEEHFQSWRRFRSESSWLWRNATHWQRHLGRAPRCERSQTSIEASSG